MDSLSYATPGSGLVRRRGHGLLLARPGALPPPLGRLRGLFASSGDFCTKLASDALFARVFARVARAVMGEGRAMGVRSRGCLDAAYCELDLRVTGLRKRLWWPAQPGRTEPSGHEEACPDTVGTARDETEGGVAEPTAAAFVHD